MPVCPRGCFEEKIKVCYDWLMFRKHFIIASIFVSILVLSGCSLSSPISTNSPSGSLWKSSDKGKNWTQKGKIDEKTFYNGDVLSIAINPSNVDNVFVGTREGGILKTEDGGENWKYLDFQSEKIYGLDIDPTDGKILYASGVWQKRGKIFKSVDAGSTWKEIYTTPSEGPLVISLVVDKKNAAIVYASTSDNQVIKTTDGGIAWKNIFSAPSPVLKLAIDHENNNLIYCIPQDRGLFRSKNGGQDFEDITSKISKTIKNVQEISVIETDPNNSNWLYAAGEIGLLRSKDAGNNWEKLEALHDTQNFPIKVLAINPSDSKEIIYGSAKAVYKSINFGNSWATFQLETAKMVSVAKYSKINPDMVYLGLAK